MPSQYHTRAAPSCFHVASFVGKVQNLPLLFSESDGSLLQRELGRSGEAPSPPVDVWALGTLIDSAPRVVHSITGTQGPSARRPPQCAVRRYSVQGGRGVLEKAGVRGEVKRQGQGGGGWGGGSPGGKDHPISSTPTDPLTQMALHSGLIGRVGTVCAVCLAAQVLEQECDITRAEH